MNNNFGKKNETFIEKSKNKISAVLNWAKENPTTAAFIVIDCIIGATTISKEIRKVHERSDMKRNERRIYDRSEGHYWECNRKLKNSDYIEINQRRKYFNESYAEILKDMKLI